MGSVPIFLEGRDCALFYDLAPGFRAVAERPAVRRHAVPDGGRADAGVRHHESGQPGARLAVHGRRLPRRRGYAVDRQLSARRGAGPRWDPGRRHGGGSDRPAHALRARPSRPGARDLRPDPVLQRADRHRLGTRAALLLAAALAAGTHQALRRLHLPGVPRGGHRGRPAGRGAPLVRRDAHAAGHADPRGRVQPHDGRRARREHQAPVHRGLRLRRSARRADGRADLRGAARHGRADPDPGVRGDRHRRHRLDPRRAGRRGHRRRGGHAGTRVSEAPARHDDPAYCSRGGGTRARLDAHLSADGRGPGGQAGGLVREPMRTRLILWGIAALLLMSLPPLVMALGQPYYVDLVRRILILAIAAISLNLILGYGGLVSFGHAAYLGIGAYAVGILGFYGITNGWIHLLVAIGASALVAAAIGAVSIRTSGIYFIMITLAFTQMLYYLGISLDVYGGDDGMRLKSKSQFAGLVDLRDPVAFYYVALGVMLLFVFLTYRIVNSRFGMLLRAAKSNEARSRAIGFSPYPYRLAAFIIAGAMCGVAGALYANHTSYITPGLMAWHQSGEMMFMVILGGMASTAGPVLVLSVVFFRRGLAGIFFKPDA